MQFCQKCGSIVVPKQSRGKTRLACGACNFTPKKRETIVLKEKLKVPEKNRAIEVVNKRVDVLPKTKETCPDCTHKEAYFWTVQTRGGDEAETRFFKCVKCNHTWRAY